MAPFFTIITASLNQGLFIQRTLTSVRNQSFNNLEHIVIDGGSTDNTLEILKAFKNTYPLTFFSEPDQGIADALNKGLRLARGNYILVLQADDCFSDFHVLENVYALLKAETADIYAFPVTMNHPEKGEIMLKPIRMKWWNRFKFIFLHQGTFVHRRIFEKIGNFNTDYKIAMDYDFFYRTLQRDPAIRFGRFPVAEMSGGGVGTRISSLRKRLQEECRVQKSNEVHGGWKLLQGFFRFFYLPYKTGVSLFFSRKDIQS